MAIAGVGLAHKDVLHVSLGEVVEAHEDVPRELIVPHEEVLLQTIVEDLPDDRPLLYGARTETLADGDLHEFVRDDMQIQYTMAMTTISVIPVLAVFFTAQKRFIQGIVLTGVKG